MLSLEEFSLTPDLLPSDITGLNYYNQKAGEFQFRPGPVFANIILADEINRATPRTQASLLECMEERQVTVDGVTRKLEEQFSLLQRRIHWKLPELSRCRKRSWTVSYEVIDGAAG